MIKSIYRNLLMLALLLVVVVGFSQNNPVVQKSQSKSVKLPSVANKNVVSQKENDKLKMMEAAFRARHKARKEEALAYAFVHNIPLKKTLEDGGFAELQYISEEGTPIYYRTYNTDAAKSTRADWLNTGGGLGFDLNGDNLVAHVWDGGHARVTHQEYDGAGGTNRVSLMDTAAEGGTQLNFHAAHVTGTIGSSGQFQAASKGMAWQSDVRGYMWNNDVAEATSQVNDGSGSGTFNFGYDMLLSNHSYGYGASGIPDPWFGQYGSDAVDWDNLMYNAPYYLMVVAAGNDGNDNTSNGSPLDGNSAFDKLSGQSTAKNNLVVANANDAVINPDGSLSSVLINSSSSEGPTDDYRIKPDITGNGTGLYSTYDNSDSAYNSITGTSMASPNVTGSLLLLQEHFENIHSAPMRASTLKGLALHTADDPDANGPDAVYGWGLLNTKKAAETITTANTGGNTEVEELTLNQGEFYSVTIQASGSEPLLASISWTDPAGTQNTGTNSTVPALVNDLDLVLDNGTTYYPWRLTAITNNSQNGENNVDPFERVDIVGASGFYTLIVTHDGSLSGGSQDFALVVTGGQIVAGAPQIAFGSISGNTLENSECNFTDINVPLNISTAATANADVNFTINGSSTASTGVDFDLITPSVTFPMGTTTTQNMSLRIYEDGFIEGDEIVIVDFTVNANGGDAVALTSFDTYTFTITNDDAGPTATFTQTIFEEDLEVSPYSITTNNSGNGSPAWSVSNSAGASSTYWTTTGNNTQFAFTSDDACNCDKSNDLLTTSAFDLSGNYTSVSLLFDHAFADIGPEDGDVLISTNNGISFTEIFNITNTSTVDGSGAAITPWVNDVAIDLTPYLGNSQVVIQFRYNDGAVWSYGMAVDNIRVVAPVATAIQTSVNTGSPASTNLNEIGSAYALDVATGAVMTGITNNQADDYGCTTISVSRAGTGAQGYDGSTGVNLVMDKRFTLSPANSIVNGDATIGFYIDTAELSGWETVSGNAPGTYTMYIARESGGILENVVPATVGAFGDHTLFTANFTGTSGDYYFGRQQAFVRCTGVAKTWNGSSWTPAGVPGNTDEVFINGNYDTATHGNLDVCAMTINNGFTLTVVGDDYIRTNGDINVDGTLIVGHQGSVVQVNPAAQVLKNPTTGVINVNVTTPVLQQRDFMVMGSPMDTETRNGVFNNAFLVLDHAPNNFNPNTHPNIPQGATNFSDLEGDFWSTYTGAINPGEGYIVRPQSGYGDPAGVSYDMTYSQGTLNNGTISRSKIYNNSNSPAGTPNVYANPYPSAIDADQFIQENGLNALYFWEHLTPPSVIVPGEGLQFDMDDVSIRNFGGGVAANNDNPANFPNNVISTGQGFAIKATANGSVNFNNTMRLTTGNTTLRTNLPEVDRLWLRVESDAYGLANNMMVGFNPNATAGIDQGYDTDRLACSVSLYSQLESGEDRMAIQTREAFRDDIKIPVGFSTIIEDNTTYTISLTNFDGDNLAGRSIYLYDTVRNTLADLTQGSYTFNSQFSTQDRRFTIVFEKDAEVILGNNDASLKAIAVYPNPTSGMLNIVSTTIQLEGIKVFDVLGREVVQEELHNVKGYQLDMSRLKASTYFVEIITPQGTIIKRIVKK